MKARRLIVSALLGVFALGVLVAPSAGAEGLRPTQVAVWGCEGFYEEPPPDYAYECEMHVDDLSGEPIWPTGTVSVNGVPVCELEPISASTGGCEYFFTAVGGQPLDWTLGYSGDFSHDPSTGVFSAPGPPFYSQPQVPFPAPAPPEGPQYSTERKRGSTTVTSPPPAPPVTRARPRIKKKPAKRTHQHLATFRFAGDTAFECELDHLPFRRCGPSFSRRVSAGKHVLRVRPAGAKGPVATFRWQVLPKRP